MLELGLKTLIAYLLGAVLGSLVMGRLRGVDIRELGSGNAGGTNALRTQGWGFALGVVLIVAYTSWITRSPYACLVAPGLGFGPLMVVGTHVAVAGHYDTAAGIAALVPFFLVSALLLLNQFPDVEADREAGRRHLPIAWGRPRAARAFVTLYALAYLSLVAGVVAGALPWPCLLGLVTLTLAIPAARDVLRHPDDVKALLPAMGRNVMVNLATPAFVAVGLFVG